MKLFNVLKGIAGIKTNDTIAKLLANTGSNSSLMPYMEGVTNYYDCKKGLTVSSWKNQASDENDAVLTGAEITQDGDLQVKCTSASYGYFDATISHSGSGEMCLYTVFKAPREGRIDQNRHIVGSCRNSINQYEAYGWFSAAIDGYNNADTLGADLWGYGCRSNVMCDDYHVAAVIKSYWEQSNTHYYKVKFYIDGVFINETSTFNTASGTKFGIGVLRDENNEFGYNDRDLPVQIKMIAVGRGLHSAEQIAQNSAWLRQYYGLQE